MLAKCLRKPRSKTAAAACSHHLAGTALGSSRVLKRLEKVVKFTDFLYKRNVLSFCGPLKSPNGFLWKKNDYDIISFCSGNLEPKPIDGSTHLDEFVLVNFTK